jgi:uncharacterized protein
MNILVICDDFYHPANVVRDGLNGLPKNNFHFAWIEDALALSPELISLFPAVILSKSNNISSTDTEPWMTPSVEQTFVQYVRQGGGLFSIHSGTAGYQETPALRSLLGGVFIRHPEQCPVTVKPKENHSLTNDAMPFTLIDEHYMMAMGDEQVNVFMTTESVAGSQPGGWTRKEGSGRVCVLTPGHNLEVWKQPDFQSMLLNGLNWVNKKVGRDE